jgi:hypothetical protein
VTEIKKLSSLFSSTVLASSLDIIAAAEQRECSRLKQAQAQGGKASKLRQWLTRQCQSEFEARTAAAQVQVLRQRTPDARAQTTT